MTLGQALNQFTREIGIKKMGLTPKEAYGAWYLVFLGKEYGPKLEGLIDSIVKMEGEKFIWDRIDAVLKL